MDVKKRLWAWVLSALTGLALFPAAAASEAPPVIQDISAGSYHALAVDDMGGLWAWGWNQYGELGDANLDNSGGDANGPFQTSPVKVMEDVVSAAAGSWASLARRGDGSLWYWHSGEPPALFLESVKTATLDKYLDGGAAVTEDGALWLWGDNSLGQLTPAGVEAERSDEPVKAMEGVTDAALGYGQVMALKADGTLWSWGHDSFGKVGAEETGDLTVTEEGYLGFAYRPVPVLIMDHVIKLAAGCNDSMALKDDGSLWAWGNNGFGVSNAVDADGQAYQNIPVRVMEDVADMASGHGTNYMVKTDGTLWACGSNSFGELGNGTVGEPSAEPVQIMTEVAKVEVGDCYALALKMDGTVWSWGSNAEGELGNGGRGNGKSIIGPTQSVPMQVRFEESVPPEDGLMVYPGVSFAVMVDGRWASFSLYGMPDEAGNRNYYIRLRELAAALGETPAAFTVEYDMDRGVERLATGERYRSMTWDLGLPFAGEQPALRGGAPVSIDGILADIDAFTLTDSAGEAYTYYKLRDLGRALGFNVRWDSGYRHEFLDVSGRVLIETDRPYAEA